jgi:hypothetical protein
MTLLNLPDPERVVVAGDWHGNLAWAWTVVEKLPWALPDERPRIVIHLGDFGIWPGDGGTVYLATLDRILKSARAQLFFVDGNHEDHEQLAMFAEGHTKESPICITERIWWLPRGCRWTWHGKEWLALGGAASPDRDIRVRHNWGWWEGECLTEADILRAVGDPPRRAHVMVTHEAPAGAPVQYYDPPPKHWLQVDLDLGETHRRAIASVAEAVRAEHLFHGHHHQAYQAKVQLAHGPVEVSGLDMDGERENWGVLNARTATWEYGYELPRREARG